MVWLNVSFRVTDFVQPDPVCVGRGVCIGSHCIGSPTATAHTSNGSKPHAEASEALMSHACQPLVWQDQNCSLGTSWFVLFVPGFYIQVHTVRCHWPQTCCCFSSPVTDTVSCPDVCYSSHKCQWEALPKGGGGRGPCKNVSYLVFQLLRQTGHEFTRH